MLSIIHDEQSALEKSISSSELPDINEIPIFIDDDRYVLASAMQKAIRRGNCEIALSAALSLLKADPIKCWNRLKVISVEDIGVANLPLAKAVFWAANHNQWRSVAFNDEAVLSFLVLELCKSANSRFSNDLLCIANMHPGYKDKAIELSRYTDSELVDLYLSKKTRIIERTIAGWYLCGVSSRSTKNLVLRTGNVQAFMDLHSPEAYPEELTSVMRRSFSSGGYGRTLAIAWEHKKGAGKVTHQNECPADTRFIGNWPSETYDIHTLRGKSAYRAILKADNPIASFLSKRLEPDKRVPAFGMTVFSLEGMFLKDREVYTGVPELLDLAVRSYVGLHSLGGAAREDFFSIVQENFHLIHEYRSRDNEVFFRGMP